MISRKEGVTSLLFAEKGSQVLVPVLVPVLALLALRISAFFAVPSQSLYFFKLYFFTS